MDQAKRKPRGRLLKFKLKSPDSQIQIAYGREEAYRVWEAIEQKFGKDSPRLVLPVELVSNRGD